MAGVVVENKRTRQSRDLENMLFVVVYYRVVYISEYVGFFGREEVFFDLVKYLF